MLVKEEQEEIWDENCDGEMEFCGSMDYYITSDNGHFDDYDDAVNHEVSWLNAVRHDCSTCIYNDLDIDRADNECYECCRGYEDHYIEKGIPIVKKTDKTDDTEVNSHGTNINIKGHILPEDKMEDIGFRDTGEYWYYYREVKFPKKYKGLEISFNVHILKDETDTWIDVLDEDFLQPYDYQKFLKSNPNNEISVTIKEFVEKQMEYLQGAGVLSGHNYGDYI